MTENSPASNVKITAAARERLERLVAHEVTRVREGLSELDLSSSLAAVAFLYTEDEDTPLVEYHYACTEAVRAEAFATDEDTGLWAVWGPADWGIEDYLDEPTDETVVLAERVANDLHDAGQEFAKSLVLQEVCWHISRLPKDALPPRTDDFAAWVSEHDINDETHQSFAKTAPETALGQYRERHWLRFPGDPEPPTHTNSDDGDPIAALADAIADRLEAELVAAATGGPWPAMAINPETMMGRDTVLPSSFKLCPPARRAEALKIRARGRRIDRMETAWIPEWWHHEGEPEEDDDDGAGEEHETPLVWSDDLERQSDAAVRELRAAGDEEPNMRVATEVCRRLNARRTQNTTDDFVAFPWGSDADLLVGVTALIHDVATDSTVASLVANDLLAADLRKLDALM